MIFFLNLKIMDHCSRKVDQHWRWIWIEIVKAVIKWFYDVFCGEGASCPGIIVMEQAVFSESGDARCEKEGLGHKPSDPFILRVHLCQQDDYLTLSLIGRKT